MNFGEWVDWIKLKPKYLLAISLLAAVLLFSPTEPMELLGLAGFRDEFRPWVGLAFLASSTFLAAHAMVKLGGWVKVEWQNKKRKQQRIESLHDLTQQEKKVIIRYFFNNTRTRTHSVEDGVVQGLVSKGVLYRPSNWVSRWGGGKIRADYNMHLWAWRYFKEHPELVDKEEL